MGRTKMLEKILLEITPKLQELESHPIYKEINSLDSLTLFMQRHVYAVFDFMSLTKKIQSEFSPINNMWVPPKDKELSRFINEIILAEESDIAPDNSFMSHFEMYCKAMGEIGTDISTVEEFLERAEVEGTLSNVLKVKIPNSAKHFITDTFNLIENGKIHEIAASFCFGREKIIPLMFQSLLDKMNISNEQAPLFYYYLKRHIEIDSDSHGPLAMKMISVLCGNDEKKWIEVKVAAINSIESRITFWNNISSEINA